MNAWMGLWWRLGQLGFEAQQVMGMRLFQMAAGGPFDLNRLSEEKMTAAMDAGLASFQAAASGAGAVHVADKAVRVYRRRVRANRRALLLRK